MMQMNALASHVKMVASALTLTVVIHVSVLLDSMETIVNQVVPNSNLVM